MDKIASASSVTALVANGVPVPTSRCQRAREVHAQNIRFAKKVNVKSRNEMKTSEIRGVLHKNANGWLAVALNENGEPVAPALTNMRGFTPVRTKRMELDALLLAFLKRLRVTRIFCNDASLLSPDSVSPYVRSEEKIHVTGYEGTFLHGLELAKKDALHAAYNGAQEGPCETEERSSATPSYEDVRDLDPSITRVEYARIYCSSRNDDGNSNTINTHERSKHRLHNRGISRRTRY